MYALSDATRIAETILARYCTTDVCSRATIAGSVRRGKAQVKDIEIVAEPILAGLFGDTPSPEFYARLDGNPPGKVIKAGSKYRQYALPEGINLDLFIVTPPAQWGVILAIRTGPAELSHKLVTVRKHGGLLPSYARVEHGAVWVGDKAMHMPEEIDFLRFVGLDGVTAQEREERYG